MLYIFNGTERFIDFLERQYLSLANQGNCFGHVYYSAKVPDYPAFLEKVGTFVIESSIGEYYSINNIVKLDIDLDALEKIKAKEVRSFLRGGENVR